MESARWGEFLGTLEGADHWAVRGASGIELLDADLASVVGSRDAWGLADWGRFVRALGRVEERGHAERVQQAQGTSANVAREDRGFIVNVVVAATAITIVIIIGRGTEVVD